MELGLQISDPALAFLEKQSSVYRWLETSAAVKK
jgi:hypothetical protein